MSQILPYAFNGVKTLFQKQQRTNLISTVMAQSCFGENMLPQLSQVFTNVLQAMQENDKDYLQQIMEPKLYHTTKICLDVLNNQGLQLKYLTNEFAEEIHQDEIQLMNQFNMLLNASFKKQVQNENDDLFVYAENDYRCNLDVNGIFGLRLVRSENAGIKYIGLPSYFVPRKYYINLKDLSAVYKNQIFVVNLLIKTQRRLIAVKPETEEVVHGNGDVNEWQYHSMRLESYYPNYNWVVTDMDNYLKGNPYI